MVVCDHLLYSTGGAHEGPPGQHRYTERKRHMDTRTQTHRHTWT